MDKSLFYHFTSEASLLIARTAGIREGIIPLKVVPDPKNVRRNELNAMNRIVWITRNPTFISMDAPIGPAKSSMLPGRKAQYRLAIRVPSEYLSNVVPWTKFAVALRHNSKLPQNLDPKIEKEINIDIGEPKDWFIFGDFIPWAWVVGVERNPSLEPDKVSIVSNPEKAPDNGVLVQFPKIDLPKKSPPSA